jgi:hypothetical protein
MNLAGARIPGNHPGLMTVKGGNGMRYAFRVAEFKKYMQQKYGEPTFSGGAGSESDFAGKQGIILFDDCGWSDATGHFDLWDGSACAHGAYWEQAKVVKLWETGS